MENNKNIYNFVQVQKLSKCWKMSKSPRDRRCTLSSRVESSWVDATIALEWQTHRLIERVAFCVCFPFSSVSFTFNGATMAKLAQCATPTTAKATATDNGNRNSWLAPGHVSECCLWSKHVSNESKNSLALCPFESVCALSGFLLAFVHLPRLSACTSVIKEWLSLAYSYAQQCHY